MIDIHSCHVNEEPPSKDNTCTFYRSFSCASIRNQSMECISLPNNETECGLTKKPLPSKNAPRTEYFGKMTEEQLSFIVTCTWMSIGAIFASFVRIGLAQLFGDDCNDPGAVGWLAAGSPLCVIAGREAEQQGGIVFADLPANLLGSFIQGMMETSTSLGLPVDTPIGWDSTDSYFQHWDIFHLVIRTGICSSLTTFCSWNSEMVIIIFGTGVSHTSSITRAFFGYLIGMQTALGSYVLGKKIAVWIHRWRNPMNGMEMDAILDRKEEGVYINRNLPVFERRYLPNLKMEHTGTDLIDLDCLRYLERWRESTANARRVNHPRLELLIEIETAILVDRHAVAPTHASAIARTLKWDVNALELWNKGMARCPRERRNQNDHVLFNPEYSTAILALLCIVMLVSSLVAHQSAHPFAITYRTIVYATMWAPPGALFRWYLTGFNGALPGNWSWLPAGTMTANVLGSVISIGLIATEYVTNSKGSWVMASLRAFKVGFIGSLTTVSTFVSEVDSFLKNPRRKDEAYVYMVMSMGLSCFFSVLMYAAVVYK